MVNTHDVKALLESPSLQQIEVAIAAKMDCSIYKDNMDILIGFIQAEIDSSMLSIDDIKDYIVNHSDEIVEFGQLLLGKAKPERLSIGIAISYSVYMIYLKEKGEQELLEYIRRRRIPKAQKVLEQLQAIQKEMNL
jgi:hypothetical protein